MSRRSFVQAPIEPLSNQAWQRVEAAVFARLDEGVVLTMPFPYVPQHSYAAPRGRRPLRWHWALSMGLSVTAAAAASVIHLARSSDPALPDSAALATPGLAQTSAGAPGASVTAPPGLALGESIAPLQAAEPTEAVQQPAAPPTPLALGAAPLAPGGIAPPSAAVVAAHDGLHVATGRETRSLAVGDSRFTLADHSEMLARGNDADGWLVELAHGRVEFDIAPRRNRPPFVIHSGDVNVRVVGTRFSVRRQSASTEVRVQRGIVEVEHQGHVARLHPGELWLDDVVAGAVHDAAPRTTTPPRPRSSRLERAATRTDRESRFDRAAGLESENVPAALELYLALARGEDAWAANALYAAARLELDQGDRASGARLLGEYMQRFPDGENSVDVEALRARLGATPNE